MRIRQSSPAGGPAVPRAGHHHAGHDGFESYALGSARDAAGVAAPAHTAAPAAAAAQFVAAKIAAPPLRARGAHAQNPHGACATNIRVLVAVRHVPLN